MNTDLILYLAMSVVAVLALAGTLIAIVCSLFTSELPSGSRQTVVLKRNGQKTTITPKGGGRFHVTISPENKKSYPRRRP
jgi:hypothetical protein